MTDTTRVGELEKALREIAYGTGVPHDRAVIRNSEFIESTFGKMRCDSDGVSDCKRCSAAAAGRWASKFVQIALDVLSRVPEAEQKESACEGEKHIFLADKTGCGVFHNHESRGYRFCPYCGLPIRVKAGEGE